FGHFGLTDHLGGTISGLRNGGGSPVEDSSGGGFGVDRVRLAVGSPGPTVATVHLNDPVSLPAQIAGDSSSVAASPLDPERIHRTQTLGPFGELAVAAGVGWD